MTFSSERENFTVSSHGVSVMNLMTIKRIGHLLCWFLLAVSSLAVSNDLEKAEQYRKFGLTDKAKELYIEIAFASDDSLFSGASIVLPPCIVWAQ